jgi:hypothetical protein
MSKSYEFIIHQGCGSCAPTAAIATVAKRPDGAMLLYHLSQRHPAQVGPYLQRMETKYIDTVVVEAYEVIEDTP